MPTDDPLKSGRGCATRLAHILAGGLGFAVSCLVACGGGAGLLSGDQSIALNGQLATRSLGGRSRATAAPPSTRAPRFERRRPEPAGHGQPHAPQQPDPGRRDDRPARRQGTAASDTDDDHADADDDAPDDAPPPSTSTTTTPTTTSTTTTSTTTTLDDDHQPQPRRPDPGTTSTTTHGGVGTRRHQAPRRPELAAAAEPARDGNSGGNGRWRVTNGTTIAGRYRIEGRLGVGGMSTVQLAFDQRLERYVAIKLLAEHLADDPTFVSRFRREALSAARLVHPNIVQVFDFGFDEQPHQHFIVMEHVPGHSCAELLRDHGHLDVEQARRRSSSRPAAGSTTRTETASCIATSSRATCSCPTPTWSSWPTSASPAPPTSRASPRSARCSAPPPTSRPSRRAARRRGRGRTSTRSASSPTSCCPGGCPTRRPRCPSWRSSSSASRRASVDELNPQVPPRAGRRDRDGAGARPGGPARDRDACSPRRSAHGARGVEPQSNGARTRNLGGTAATRVLSGRRAPTAQTRVAPRTGPPTSRTAAHARQPRQLEPRRPAYPPPMGGYGPDEARPPDGGRARRGGSRAARRFFAFLAVVVLFVAAVAVAITIAAEHVEQRRALPQGRRPRHERRGQPASEDHQPVHEIAAPVASPVG